MICPILSRASNSVGFGGVGPASNRSRLALMPDDLICDFRSSSSILSFTSSEVIPMARSLMSNRRPRAGLRISRPSRMVFLPSSAKLTARFAALKVLPSPEVDEVNRIALSFSFIMNWIFVRMLRNISSVWLFLFSCTTIPAAVFASSLAIATSATMGMSVRRITSS